MASPRVRYICEACGHSHAKAWGWCQACGQKDTLCEQNPLTSSLAIPDYNSLPEASQNRLLSEWLEFDEVCGGGLVPGSVLLLGGEPGTGKSTLLSQICSRFQQQGKRVIYFSGEETSAQIKSRIARLQLHLFPVLSTQSLEVIVKVIEKEKPDLIVVDSVQTLKTAEPTGAMEQMRASVMEMVHHSKQMGCVTLLVGHVTKSGALAGPKMLEHMVDVVLNFEGEEIKTLRTSKNRFGSTDEMALFRMTEKGLESVPDPSAHLCSFRSAPTVGSIIFPSKEGRKPVLLEIQALVANSHLQMPRRSVVGWCHNRLAMILAVLETHAKLILGPKDIYLNVVGGMRIMDTATADLAVASALWSSAKQVPLPPHMCAFGEITLSGEVRPAQYAEERIKLAQRYGVVKHLSFPRLSDIKDIKELIREE